MKLFKNGGTCATPMTLAQRNKARIKAAIRSMGAAYLLHPENTESPWGIKQHYSARLTEDQLRNDTREALNQ
jgi:hypothetical protein